jgi:hypothetical protein
MCKICRVKVKQATRVMDVKRWEMKGKEELFEINTRAVLRG